MVFMEVCSNHVNHTAVERCEMCNKPLCGLCLWYAADGRRLCEQDAKRLEAEGIAITHPQTYAEAIELTPFPVSKEQAEMPYQGNQIDLQALIGAVLGVAVLASCTGLVYCLPVVVAILGGYAYINADRSLYPQRTRTLSIVSLAVAGVMFLFVFVAFVFFAFGIGMAIISSGTP